MSEAAARLERTARMLRDVPQPDQHEAVIELLCMVISQVAMTSPAATADMAELVVRVMRN